MTTSPSPTLDAKKRPSEVLGVAAIISAAALGWMTLAVVQSNSWDDAIFLVVLGIVSAFLARNLAHRKAWAWQACCWIALGAMLLGGTLSLWLSLDMLSEWAGWREGYLLSLRAKVALLAVFVVGFVATPVAIGYALTRPRVRAWFGTAECREATLS